MEEKRDDFERSTKKDVRKNLEEQFKKTVLGGYSKTDVLDYVVGLNESSEFMRTNLEKQIQDLLGEKSILSRECGLLRSQIADIEGLQEEKSLELERKMDLISQEKEELTLRLQELNDKNRGLELELAENREELALIKTLEEAIVAKDRELIELTSKKRALSGELSSSKDRVLILEEEIEKLNRQLVDLPYRVESIKEQEALIEELTSELKALKEKESSVERAFRDEKNKSQEILGNLRQAEMKVQELEDRLHEEVQKFLAMENDFKASLEAEKERTRAAEEEVEKLHREMEELKTRLESQYQSSLEEEKLRTQEAEKRIEALGQEIQNLKNQLEATKNLGHEEGSRRAQEAEEKLRELYAEMEALQTSLESEYSLRLAEEREKTELLNQQIESIQRRLEEEGLEKTKLERELEELRARNLEEESKSAGLLASLGEASEREEQLRSQLESIQGRLDEEALEKARLEDELESLKSRSIEENGSLVEARDKLSLLEEELTTARLLLEEEINKNTGLVAQLEEARAIDPQELQELREQANYFEAKYQEEKARAQRFEASLDNIKRELEEEISGKLELEEENGRLAGLEEELQRRGQVVDSLEAEKTGLEEELSLLNRGYEALRSHSEGTIKKLEEEARMGQIELQKLVEVTRLKEELQDKLSQEENRLQESQYEIDNLIERLKIFEERLADERLARQELEARLDENQDKHQTLVDDYNILHRSYSDSLEKNRALRSEAELLSEMIESFQRRDKEYILIDKSNEEYRHTIKNLEETISTILLEMEKQTGVFNDLLERYRASDEKVRVLTEEKTQIQIRNVDLLNQINLVSSNLKNSEEQYRNLMRRFDGFDYEVEARPDEDTDSDKEDDLARNAIELAKGFSKSYTLEKKIDEVIAK